MCHRVTSSLYLSGFDLSYWLTLMPQEEPQMLFKCHRQCLSMIARNAFHAFNTTKTNDLFPKKFSVLFLPLDFPELADLTSGSPEAPEQRTKFDKKGVQERDNEKSIKSLYSSLMRSSQEQVEVAINSLVEKLTRSPREMVAIPGAEDMTSGEGLNFNSLAELFLRLTEQFPLDVGCLSVFFLNYVKLKPGEAIFLKVCPWHVLAWLMCRFKSIPRSFFCHIHIMIIRWIGNIFNFDYGCSFLMLRHFFAWNQIRSLKHWFRNYRSKMK